MVGTDSHVLLNQADHDTAMVNGSRAQTETTCLLDVLSYIERGLALTSAVNIFRLSDADRTPWREVSSGMPGLLAPRRSDLSSQCVKRSIR